MSAQASHVDYARLEQEMAQIRSMLSDFGLKNRAQNGARLSDLVRQVEADDNSAIGGTSYLSGNAFENEGENE